MVIKNETAENHAPNGFAGGLLNHGDSATLNQTTVSGNCAGVAGGGIANINFGLPSTPAVAVRLNVLASLRGLDLCKNR